MDKDQIYKVLNQQGLNIVMIAKALNVSKQSIHQVISEGKGSRRIATAIAKSCNMSLGEIFPYYKEQESQRKAKQNLQAEINERLKSFA